MAVKDISANISFDGYATPPAEACPYCESGRQARRAIRITGPKINTGVAVCSDCARHVEENYITRVLAGLID